MRILKRFILFFCWTVAVFIIVLAVGLNVVRFSLPYFKQPRERLQSWVSSTLHVPVKIKKVEAYWRGLDPVVEFADVRILDKNQKYILGQVHYLKIKINFLDSLLHRQILPDRIIVNGSRLTLHQQKDGRLIFIKPAEQTGGRAASSEGSLTPADVLLWLLHQSNIVVRGVDVKVDLLHNKTLQLKNFSLDLNHDQIDQLQGKVTLLQPEPGSLSFVYKPATEDGRDVVSGKLYLQLKGFRPEAFFPLLGQEQPKFLNQYAVDGGAWDGRTWIDIKQGGLSSAQVVGRLRNLAWHATSGGKRFHVNHISGNAFWKKQDQGWQVSVEDLDFQSDALHLGKYTAALQFESASQSYAVKVKHIDLAQWQQWYHSPFKQLLPDRVWKQQQLFQPRGVLDELSLGWHKLSLNSEKTADSATSDSTSKKSQAVSKQPVDTKKPVPVVKQAADTKKVEAGSKQSVNSKKHADSYSFLKQIDQISFDGSGLGWREHGAIPGVTGLNGHGVYTPGQAHLTITSVNKMTIHAGRFFPQPMAVDFLQGKIDWNGHANDWNVAWKNIQLNSKSLQASAHGVLSKKGNGALQMHSATDFSIKDISQLQSFLPDTILHKTLKDWLQHAFISGSLDQGRFKWDGPVHRLASDSTQENRWDVRLHTLATDFHYADHWPDLMAMDSQIDFHGAAMHVAAKAHFPAGVKVQTIVADIPDLTHAELSIESQLSGDLQQARAYLINTPLSIKHGVEQMEMSGLFDSQLKLHIPLDDMKQKTGVNGVFNISHAKISLPKWGFSGKDAAGIFKIINGDLFAKDVKMNMFGRPALVQVGTRLVRAASKKYKNSTALVVDINGLTTVADLMHDKRFFFSPHVHGYFPFKSHLLLYSEASGRRNMLALKTDGKGLVIDMPPPFNKKTNDTLPVRTTLLFSRQSSDPMILKIIAGKKWSMGFALEKRGQTMAVTRGKVRLNASRVTIPKMPGIIVSGSLFKLSWPQWKPYLFHDTEKSAGPSITGGVADSDKSGQSDKVSATDSNLLRLVDLQVGILQYDKYLFKNISFKLWPEKNRYRLFVDSEKLVGGVTVPKSYPHGVVRLDLKTCRWPFDEKSSQGLVSSTINKTQKAGGAHDLGDLSPKTLPAIEGQIGKLYYKKHDLGRVVFDVKRDKDGLFIKKLTTNSPDFSADLSGSWIVENNQQYSKLKGSIHTENMGVTAKEWSITDMLADGKGVFDFDLQWRAPLLPPKLSKANGWISLKVTDGRIVNLGKDAQEKMGLGKLLNLLSLQTLPRRLALDFSDLTEKGYSYDTMKVKFNLRDGRGVTDDGYLNGPVANVNVKGVLDFSKSFYDLTLDVRPHLTSTLPLIATIAGTPIAGAIAWVVNKAVVGPVVGRIARKVIHMKGYLDRPDVPKVVVKSYSGDKNN